MQSLRPRQIAGEALYRYMNRGNPERRHIPLLELAVLLEVTAVAVHGYTDGSKSPTDAKAHLIAAWSNGAVPADMWADEDERDRRLRLKLAKLYPEYRPRKAA